MQVRYTPPVVIYDIYVKAFLNFCFRRTHACVHNGQVMEANL